MNNQRGIKSITLSELTASIGATLHSRFGSGLWVVGEVSECKVNSSGHCYLSLVERVEGSSAPLAEIRAAIWSRQYREISARFRQTTGEQISSGMKLLMYCTVSFHSVYGLSLVINDIDATFTIGESELLKRQTLERLEREGVINLQKEQNALPYVAQRFAVISSATAAGYEDFCKQIEASPYRIELTLFEAMMQGEKTASTIISAMNRVLDCGKEFDAVVIIRGGGSASDLRWFDSYDLSFHIAQFPLPVLTGIGHEKDVSVADMVAYYYFKTPTAVAAGLIQRIEVVDGKLVDFSQRIENISQTILSNEWQRVSRSAQQLKIEALNIMGGNNLRLERLRGELSNLYTQTIGRESSRIDGLYNRMIQESQFLLQSSQRKVASAAELLRRATLQATGMENNRLQRLEATLLPTARAAMQGAYNRHCHLSSTLTQYSSRTLDGASAKLEYLNLTFCRKASEIVQREESRLTILNERVAGHNPRRILSLGYAIAMDSDGKAIKSVKNLKAGDNLRVEFSDGTVETKVNTIQ